MIRKALLTIPVLLLPLAACARSEEAAPPASPDASAATAPQTGGAPIGPISSREPAGGGSTVPQEGSTSSIGYDVPAGWQAEPPANEMRVGQATIPGAGGPGNLVVFYFGPGGGGGVQDNIQRWVDQMEPEAGANPQPESFDANGFRVTWIDVSGTLKPSMMGTGPSTPQPNSRLLGAVVEGPGGPWFFKATGPQATLTAERENFLQMLRSVRAK